MRHQPRLVVLSVFVLSGTVTVMPAAAQTDSSEAPHVLTAVPSTELPTVQAAVPEQRAFRDLFALAADDFRRLASKESAIILSIGGLAAGIGHGSDRNLSVGMSSAPRLRGMFGPGETIGGARMQAAAAIATYSLGRITSNATLTHVGGDLIRAQIVTQMLTAAVKNSVRRTRPDGTQYSFPSGHSAVTFASATVVQRHFGWKAGVPAYGLATYVAASRIQAKRHYFSDVAFGAAIGIAAGRTVTIGHGDRRFAVAPMAVAGGGGVSLTWIGGN